MSVTRCTYNCIALYISRGILPSIGPFSNRSFLIPFLFFSLLFFFVDGFYDRVNVGLASELYELT